MKAPGNANIDAPMEGGSTPLSIASQQGHVEVVKELLKGNANIDAPMEAGSTPLCIASQNGPVEVVKELLTGNANIDAPLFENEATPRYLMDQLPFILPLKMAMLNR